MVRTRTEQEICRRDDGCQLYVVELDDSLGPRRCADLPHVHVGWARDPESKVERLQAGTGKPRELRDRIVGLRPDLLPSDARSKEDLKDALAALGYTVRNRERTTWRTYVIELDPKRLEKDVSAEQHAEWVYVGQTSHPVEFRFRQHVDGVLSKKGQDLSSRYPRQAGVRLRRDLMSEAVLFTKEQAGRAEAVLARDLKAAGFGVLGGH